MFSLFHKSDIFELNAFLAMTILILIFLVNKDAEDNLTIVLIEFKEVILKVEFFMLLTTAGLRNFWPEKLRQNLLE